MSREGQDPQRKIGQKCPEKDKIPKEDWAISKAEQPTLEMATNAGMRLTNQEANIAGFGTVWYDEGAIANIFSFAELVEKH